MGIAQNRHAQIWYSMMDDVGNELLRKARPDVFTHTIDPSWETLDGFLKWASSQPYNDGRFDRKKAHAQKHYGPQTCGFVKPAPQKLKTYNPSLYNPVTRQHEVIGEFVDRDAALQALQQRKREIAIELAGGPDNRLPEVAYQPVHRQYNQCAFYDYTQHPWPLTFYRREFVDSDGARHSYTGKRPVVIDRKKTRETCREATVLANFARQSADIEHIMVTTDGYTAITRTNGLTITANAVEDALMELDHVRMDELRDAREHNSTLPDWL